MREHLEDIVMPIRFNREKIYQPMSPSVLNKNKSSFHSVNENSLHHSEQDELEAVFILSSN